MPCPAVSAAAPPTPRRGPWVAVTTSALASAVAGTTAGAVSFALSNRPPRKDRQLPPRKPGDLKTYGDYNFRATVRQVRDAGQRANHSFEAKCVGYDVVPTIADDTLRACKIHARGMPGGEAAYRFDEPQLVMLPGSSDKAGGIFFQHKGTIKRIV